MNKFEKYRFKKVSFPTYSDVYLDLTPMMLEELQGFVKQSKPPKIVISLIFRTGEYSYPENSWKKIIQLNFSHINQLAAVLTSGCQPPEKSRESELFLTIIPNVKFPKNQK